MIEYSRGRSEGHFQNWCLVGRVAIRTRVIARMFCASTACTADDASMILCIPFLASDPDQFDPRWIENGWGVEANLFDRDAIMDTDVWQGVRATVRRVARDERPPAFTFHFPVNDCDYLADPVVERRLFEAIDLVADNGLDGLVLHSNRIRSVAQWRQLDVEKERQQYVEYVHALADRVGDASFWIGLENMPITGNDALELDPLLVFPEDFDGLSVGNIGITWDFCHYSYSVYVAELLAAGELVEDADCYPNVRSSGYLDFARLGPMTVHHHFSSFEGVATRAGGVCREGALPTDGVVPESVNEQAFALIAKSERARTVTLEIREHDYHNRQAVYEAARWCEQRLASQ
ncbi:hypothetical protein [Streptomyces rubiginosohelvolus]|uniref:hypothetical protein n=1 Tax=Streptomyces rubiginosohelvolus TaxID=67362 RepID=UPI00367DEB12